MMRIILSLLLATFCCIDTNAQVTPDTLEIGGITVIRDTDSTISLPPKKRIFKKLDAQTRLSSVKTEWLIMDVGFSNYVDGTNYSLTEAQAYAPGSNKLWFELKPYRSHNFNLWVITQTHNLLNHYVNFQYAVGFEFNNYRYKQPIRYAAAQPQNHSAIVTLDAQALSIPPARTYKKNKLGAHYLTVPLLVNFNLTPNRLYNFEVSTGISVGYLISSRQKTITSDEGKRRIKDDFALNPWKLSYVGNIRLGLVSFYGSYAFKSMYKRGLDVVPYNVGIRINPAGIFSKLETR